MHLLPSKMIPRKNTTIPNETAMRNKDFRILVVIPTLGERLDTLVRTIKSIKSQSDVFVDITLVAKCISPELASIKECYNVEIIVNQGNISTAINAGISSATNIYKYLAWLGDDDMLRPNALAASSALLESNPEAVVSYGSCDYIDYNGTVLFNRRPPILAPFLLHFVPGLIKQETCLFRITALERIGGLNKELKYTMDLDLLLRLYKIGHFVKSENVLAAFCWHPGSITIANRKASLTEAQNIQSKHAKGVFKIIEPFWKYPIRYLILLIDRKVNRQINKDPLHQK